MSSAAESMIENMRRTPSQVPLNAQLPNREGVRRRWSVLTPVSAAALASTAAAEPVAPVFDLEALKDAARMEGEREGLLAAQTKIETLAQRYLDAIARLDKATRDLQKPNPTEIVDLALATAGELVGHEMSVDRDVLVNTVEQALANVEEKRGVIVRMGKTDLAYLMSRRPELVGAGYFVDDDTLGIGGCVIETPQRVIDLGIERRLDAVRHSLCELFLPPEPADDSVVETGEIEDVGDASSFDEGSR